MSLPFYLDRNSQPLGFMPQAQAAPQGGFDMAALIQALQGMQQPVAPPDFGAIFRAQRESRAPRHYGIGGALISQDNPYGNPGGDPFKNGFFKPTATPVMNVLAGSPRPDAGQLAMLRGLQASRQPAPVAIPPGDPQARAFWQTQMPQMPDRFLEQKPADIKNQLFNKMFGGPTRRWGF